MSEQEPLLGRPGDAAQSENMSIYGNLVLGAASVAQAGILILTAIIWAGIFSHNLNLVAPHALLNSTAILLLAQAALILQPTHTPKQKRTGTFIHAALNTLAIVALWSGLIVIEINKFRSHGSHFYSPHGIMGLILYIFSVLQSMLGILAFFFPGIFGSVEQAKKLYKYHRMSGYFIFVWSMATICAATWTTYNLKVLKIPHWSVITASIVFLAGLGSRIKKEKLGMKAQ